MAMTINTNVVSINSQRNLSLSGSSLATSMQRLSSGLRVNSAKDDAAGLAISERMKAQSSGLAVAARNANDGISLAQTAEGAMSKVGDMLQRMRELAVQSANATNSKTDREAMQAEVKQLVSEIDRVAKTSEFNGTKLLNGDFAGAVFQVGAKAGDNITVGSIASMEAESIGKANSASVAAGTLALTSGEIAALTDIKMKVGTGSDVTLGSVAKATSVEERANQLVSLINAKSAETGVTAYLTDDKKGYTLNSVETSTGAAAASVTFTVTGGTEGTLGFTSGTAKNLDANTDSLDKVDVSSQVGAWKAIQQIDKALDEVNTARGALGALQTRFEKSIENIDIMNENISAARGRIVDADFAAETANLSRSQILQQAGTAMVAQANQLPQNVLSLLR